jgi:hypothetical protein
MKLLGRICAALCPSVVENIVFVHSALGHALIVRGKVFDARAALQAVDFTSQLDINSIESLFSAVEMAKTLGRFLGKNQSEIDDLLHSINKPSQ